MPLALIQHDVFQEVGPIQLQGRPEVLQVQVSFEESLDLGLGNINPLDVVERNCHLPEQRVKLHAIVEDAVLLPEALDSALGRVDWCITHLVYSFPNTPFHSLNV